MIASRQSKSPMLSGSQVKSSQVWASSTELNPPNPSSTMLGLAGSGRYWVPPSTRNLYTTCTSQGTVVLTDQVPPDSAIGTPVVQPSDAKSPIRSTLW